MASHDMNIEKQREKLLNDGLFSSLLRRPIFSEEDEELRPEEAQALIKVLAADVRAGFNQRMASDSQLSDGAATADCPPVVDLPAESHATTPLGEVGNDTPKKPRFTLWHWQRVAAGLVLFFCLGLATGAAQIIPLPRWFHLSYEKTRKVGAELTAQGKSEATLDMLKRFLPHAAGIEEVVTRREMAAIYYAKDEYEKLIAIVTPSLRIAHDLFLLRSRIAAYDALGKSTETLQADLEAAASLGDEDAQRRLEARKRQQQRERPRERPWEPVAGFAVLGFT